MKRNAARILVSLLAALGLTAALAVTAFGGDDGGPAGTVVSERYDLSLPLPAGWHPSSTRLVDLLMPREVISVGTFGMAPGDGGNCGREPAAAIGRMRSGDALLTVQEYALGPDQRRRLRSNFAADPRLGPLVRVGGAYAGDAAGVPLYTATIPFRESGRAFDALVYFGGRPSAAERAAVAAILDGLRFGPDGAFSGGVHGQA